MLLIALVLVIGIYVGIDYAQFKDMNREIEVEYQR